MATMMVNVGDRQDFLCALPRRALRPGLTNYSFELFTAWQREEEEEVSLNEHKSHMILRTISSKILMLMNSKSFMMSSQNIFNLCAIY